MIGNGWISGPEQYSAYVPFAQESGLLVPGSDAEKVALSQQERCLKVLDEGAKDDVDSKVCENILQEILRTTQKDGECVNMYDVRLRDSYPSCGMNWPPDLTQMTPYLRREDVLRALHVNKDKTQGWVECNGQVGASFTVAKSKPSKVLLPQLLTQVPIVLFSGDQDMICNHVGTENIINGMEWNGKVGMEVSPGVMAPKQNWVFDGEPAGQYQYARNLTYVKFYNSSHMVPFDYPRRTRDMLDRFMGVDIQSIGGQAIESSVDGEKTTQTSVSANPDSDTAKANKEAEILQEATWTAYRRSGELALVIVLIAASAWGYFIWRERRRRRGYRGVFGNDPYDDAGTGLNGRFRSKQHRDLEEAHDFNEAELDDMSSSSQDLNRDRFELGDDDGEPMAGRPNGHAA